MPSPDTTISSGAPTRRSNRPVTQFAVRNTEEFLLGKSEPSRKWLQNTTVEVVQEDKRSMTLFVRLYHENILTMTMSLPEQELIHVCVSVGTTFSMNGYPTKTTLERLNGLLDCMGFHGVIPEKVRAFKDPEGTGLFFFGKGDQRVPIGQYHARNIILTPDPDELIIQSSDIDQDWAIMKKKVIGSSIVYEKQKRLSSNA